MIQRQAHQPVSENLPELALIIGIPAERVQACSASWKKTENGIIMEAKPGRFKIELKG